VTAVLDDPLTVAAAVVVPPPLTLIVLEGVSVTPTPTAACIVTDALADLEVSCTLVTVTTSLPLLMGAVYNPALVTLPLCAVHVTAEL
jgi:hypothetical protein